MQRKNSSEWTNLADIATASKFINYASFDNNISYFLKYLNQVRNYHETFPPQPLLAYRSDEQIEEDGVNEEIDSQLINQGINGNIKNNANRAKGAILNYFIEQGNPKPIWYNW
ncbi:MAG: hypothetical protein EZS28_016800 [Streblomastix strix]|uniref:Uncharacterized protein n=1 Tax=Streblomastix strix TaxID=222440 RepID=A0A5J4VZI2_9EUKA|nr:MAG: hypothetical protein EZS28_016800 [Streblomastix strix]